MMDEKYIGFCKQECIPEECWESCEKHIKETLGYQWYLLGGSMQELRLALIESASKYLPIDSSLGRLSRAIARK